MARGKMDEGVVDFASGLGHIVERGGVEVVY